MSEPNPVEFYPLPEVPRHNIMALAHLSEPKEPNVSFETMLVSLCRCFDAATEAGNDFGNAIGIALEKVMTGDGFRYSPDDQEWCKKQFYGEESA